MRGSKSIIGKVLVFCLLWAMVSMPLATAFAQESVEFYGTVVDGDGYPLSGVAVKVVSIGLVVKRLETGANGQWRVSLPEGAYQFQFEKSGYQLGTRSASTSDSATKNMGFVIGTKKDEASPLLMGISANESAETSLVPLQGLGAVEGNQPMGESLLTGITVEQQVVSNTPLQGIVYQTGESDAQTGGSIIAPLPSPGDLQSGLPDVVEQAGDPADDSFFLTDNGASELVEGMLPIEQVEPEDPTEPEAPTLGVITQSFGGESKPVETFDFTDFPNFIDKAVVYAADAVYTLKWDVPKGMGGSGLQVESYSITAYDNTKDVTINSLSISGIYADVREYTLNLPYERDVRLTLTMYCVDKAGERFAFEDFILVSTPYSQAEAPVGQFVGETFTFALRDTKAETVMLSVDGQLVSAQVADGRAVATYTFDAPGTYDYVFELLFPAPYSDSITRRGGQVVVAEQLSTEPETDGEADRNYLYEIFGVGGPETPSDATVEEAEEEEGDTIFIIEPNDSDSTEPSLPQEEDATAEEETTWEEEQAEDATSEPTETIAANFLVAPYDATDSSCLMFTFSLVPGAPTYTFALEDPNGQAITLDPINGSEMGDLLGTYGVEPEKFEGHESGDYTLAIKALDGDNGVIGSGTATIQVVTSEGADGEDHGEDLLIGISAGTILTPEDGGIITFEEAAEDDELEDGTLEITLVDAEDENKYYLSDMGTGIAFAIELPTAFGEFDGEDIGYTFNLSRGGTSINLGTDFGIDEDGEGAIPKAKVTTLGIYTLTITATYEDEEDLFATGSVSFTVTEKLGTPEVEEAIVLHDVKENFVLSWDEVEDATSYIITCVELNYTGSNRISIPATEYSFGKLAKGGYTFEIVASNAAGSYEESEPATVEVQVKDAIPAFVPMKGLADNTRESFPLVHEKDKEMNVRWDLTGLGSVEEYGVTIKRGTVDILTSTLKNKIVPGNPTQSEYYNGFIIPASLLGTTGDYTIIITARGATTADLIPFTAESTFTVQAFLGEFNINAIADHIQNTDLQVSWGASANATSYSLSITPPSGTAQNFTPTPNTSAVIGKAQFAAKGAYTLSITAKGPTGYAERKQTISFNVVESTTPPPPENALPKPVVSNVTSHATSTALVIAWGKVTNADAYSAKLTLPGGAERNGIVSVGTDAVNAVFDPSYFATVGQYTVTVTAYNTKGTYSPGTTTVTFPVTAGANMAPPVIEPITAATQSQPLTIKWAAVAGAVSYTSTLYTPSGQAVAGLINSTTATYGADYLKALGTYTVVVRAVAQSQAYVESSATFQVQVGLPAPKITAFTKHTAGKDLEVKWTASTGAVSYAIYLTKPDGTTIQQLTSGTSTVIPGDNLKATGTYTLKVVASATGYAPSADLITFKVSKSSSSSGSGSTGGSNTGGNSTGDRLQTGNYKGAFGTTDQRKQTFAYVDGLYNTVRNDTQQRDLMDLLIDSMAPLSGEWTQSQYSQARIAAMSDYALSYAILLVSMASANDAYQSQDALQVIASAVSGLMDMILDPANNIDINARNAITLLRDRFKVIATSASIGVLPDTRQGVVELLMSRVLDTLDSSEQRQAMSIVQDVYAALVKVEAESLQYRSLTVAHTLVSSLERQLTSALNDLPANATKDQVEAVQEMYLRYLLALAQLETVAIELAGADKAEIDQYIAQEKGRYDKIMSEYARLLGN